MRSLISRFELNSERQVSLASSQLLEIDGLSGFYLEN